MKNLHVNPLQHAAQKMLAKLDEIDPDDVSAITLSVVLNPPEEVDEPETKAEAKKEEVTGKEPNGKPEGEYNGADDEADEPKDKPNAIGPKTRK